MFQQWGLYQRDFDIKAAHFCIHGDQLILSHDCILVIANPLSVLRSYIGHLFLFLQRSQVVKGISMCELYTISISNSSLQCQIPASPSQWQIWWSQSDTTKWQWMWCLSGWLWTLAWTEVMAMSIRDWVGEAVSYTPPQIFVESISSPYVSMKSTWTPPPVLLQCHPLHSTPLLMESSWSPQGVHMEWIGSGLETWPNGRSQ